MADEEDPVCQLPALKEACKTSDCSSTLKHYQDCVERITAKGGGDCEPYYFDLLKVRSNFVQCVTAACTLTPRPSPAPLPLRHCSVWTNVRSLKSGRS